MWGRGVDQVDDGSNLWPPTLFTNLRTSQHFRRELLHLPGVPGYLVWGDKEAGCEAGRSQHGMGLICITLSKDRKADSMLKSETSPACTIHWLEIRFETDNASCHSPVT